MTEKYYIKGGTPLKGEVSIGGAKNSVLKLMAAALLAKGETKIYNVPDLTDVEIMLSVIAQLGAVTHYDKKENFILRFNYCATDLQASIGMEEFKHIERMIEVRKDIASFYDSAILESKLSKFSMHDSEEPSYYRYVCMLNGEMNIYDTISMFERHKVEVAKPIFKPLHQYLNLPKEDFPNTEKAYLNSISLPIYPTLQKNEADLICKLIKQIR